VISNAGVEIAHGVQNGEILRVLFYDLVVLSNSSLQLALLDILLRCAEDLRLVEPEPECHSLDKRVYASMLPKTDPKSLLSSLLLRNWTFFLKRQNGPQISLNYHRIATLPIDAEVTNG